MRIETRNLGVTDAPGLEQRARAELRASLRSHHQHIDRIRVRFVPMAGHGSACRVRVWCDRGPTIVVEERAHSSLEALHAAAGTLRRTLGRRMECARARMRRAGPRALRTQEAAWDESAGERDSMRAVAWRDAGAARPEAVPGPRKRVLFAMAEGERHANGLRRAFVLARALDADLHVLLLLPDDPAVNPLIPYVDGGDALRIMQNVFEVYRATRAWVGSILGEALPLSNVQIRSGSLVKQTAEHAGKLGASLIVVPCVDRPRWGETAVRLAQTAARPVFVARKATSSDAIVAATDLEDATYPVIRRAVDLGGRLGAPVVVVHNAAASDEEDEARDLPSWEALREGGADVVATAVQARRQSERSDAVLAVGLEPAEAIVAEARACDADIIVVGARPHTPSDGLTDASVAARVVNRAPSSVLVTPLVPPRANGSV